MTNQPFAIYERSQSLVDYPTRQLRVLVCGAGMAGSWVVAALARMVHEVTVIDPDRVEMVNVGVQQYSPNDEGLLKVEATLRRNDGLSITPIEGRMEDSLEILHDFDVVVSCVDSMSGRKWLAEQCKDSVPLFIDVRIMGEMVCILSALNGVEQDSPTYEQYLATVLPDEEVEEAPCGAEGTVYSGMYSAVRVATIVNNFASRLMVPRAKEVWSVSTMELLDGKVSEVTLLDELKKEYKEANQYYTNYEEIRNEQGCCSKEGRATQSCCEERDYKEYQEYYQEEGPSS